jgi:hypothetical protein
VIISSLRLVYLKMVLESINNQIAQFPKWLASKRYAFVHLHPKNYKNGILGQIQALAQMHGFLVHVFEGLDDPSATMSMNANHVWYPITNFTFSKLGFQEALFWEGDAMFAPDALLMASALFQEKWKRMDVHSICLGGWSGEN